MRGVQGRPRNRDGPGDRKVGQSGVREQRGGAGPAEYAVLSVLLIRGTLGAKLGGS